MERHDVALAPTRLAAHDRARSGGNGGRVVGGGVVVDVDCRLRQRRAKVTHHLGDGGGLVVAGDEDGNARAAEGSISRDMSVTLCRAVKQGVVFHEAVE